MRRMGKWSMVRGMGLACLVMLALSAGCEKRAGRSSPSAGGAGASALTWQTDLDAALEQAKSQGKTVLVLVTSRQCPWCRKLERETLTDARVRQRLARLILVRMDYERHSATARSCGVPGVPTTVALRPDGSIRKMLVGYRASGKYLQFLESLEGEE